MSRSNLYRIIALKLKLRFRGKKKAILFGLWLGELQFLENIITGCEQSFDNLIIIIAHENEQTYSELIKKKSAATKSYKHIFFKDLAKNFFSEKEIDLFITSDGLGISNLYSVYTFHGQPSKGLTFSNEKLNSFDAFFLYGKMHSDALAYFVCNELQNVLPSHLQLYEVGYAKSDDVINNKWGRNDALKKLALPLDRKTIVYAPAFNEHASLRDDGINILKELCTLKHRNIIAKLPIDCLQPKDNIYANGGIDWFDELTKLESQYPNFKLYKEDQIDPLLVSADLLITCMSSVSFEFLALRKPVLFIDTPNFYTNYLKKLLPNRNINGWDELVFVNAGKKFGTVIKEISELAKIPETILNSVDNNQPQDLTDYLLYNPGHATKATINQISLLLQSGVKTKRAKTFTYFTIQNFKQFVLDKWGSLDRRIIKGIENYLNRRGYLLKPANSVYIDADQTIQAATSRGLSICDYLETENKDKRKIGRRDRIIERLFDSQFLKDEMIVCEIGTGTGMYLEKLLQRADVERYEVYEVNTGWKDYIVTEFSNKIKNLIVHNADGNSLSQTNDSTVDIVHAHAVFVYIPLIDVYNYLKDCVRVCKKGGWIIFDVISDEQFTVEVAESWLVQNHKFPVIIPDSFIKEFARNFNLSIENMFNEIYGGSFSKYYVLKKC